MCKIRKAPHSGRGKNLLKHIKVVRVEQKLRARCNISAGRKRPQAIKRGGEAARGKKYT